MRKIHEIIPPADVGYVLNPEHSFFAIVTPEDTINLIVNPECADTYGYYGRNASVTLSSVQQRRGATSLLVIPSVANGGVYNRFSAALTADTNYTFSVDIFGPGRMEIYFGDTNGVPLGETLIYDAPPFWNRVSLSVRTSGTPISVGVRSVDGTEFFADGFQLEQKPYATTFVSGNLEAPADTTVPGRLSYGWMGPTHRSASFRTKFVRSGGRPISMHEMGFEVTDFSGFGYMAPELITSQLALSQRRLYQGARMIERQFTIGGYLQGNTLVDVLRRRGTTGASVWGGDGYAAPIVVQAQFYDGAMPVSELVEIECVYAGGLEGVMTNLYQEKAIVNFRAWRPAMRAEGNRGAAIDMIGSVAGESVVRVVNEDNTTDVLPGTGITLDAEFLPYRLAIGSDGQLYMANGKRLSRFSFGSWSTIYTSTNGWVKDVVAAGNGYLYFIVEDQDDGGIDGRCLRYSPSVGVVENPGLGPVLFHIESTSAQDLLLTRVKYNAKYNRIYVLGNFSDVTVNGVGVSGHDACIVVCDISNHIWSALPALGDYDINGDHSVIYDATWDGMGRLWVGGKIRRMGAPAYPTTTSNGLYRLITNNTVWEAAATAMPCAPPKAYATGQIQTCSLRTPSGGGTTVTIVGGVLADWPDLEPGSAVTCNGATRVIAAMLTATTFSITSSVDWWHGGAGYSNWAYTSGDVVTFMDSGIRALEYDPVNDLIYVGGKFNYVTRYDGAVKIVRNLYSEGLARMRASSDSYYAGVDYGLAPSFLGYTTPAGEPYVEDLVLHRDGKTILVVGEFDGVNSGGIWTNIASPGVALIESGGKLVKPHDPISAPRKNTTTTLAGYAGAITIAPERTTFGTNAYTPIDLQSYSEWYGDISGALVTPSGNSIYFSFSPNHATTLRETPITTIFLRPGATAIPRLEIRGPCTLRRIVNTTSGRFLNPNLTIAKDEVVIFSFIPGPIWIRSTKKGDITYDQYGRDSFPDLGLVSGYNRILVDADYQTGCQAWLYWQEEYPSVDDLVARSFA